MVPYDATLNILCKTTYSFELTFIVLPAKGDNRKSGVFGFRGFSFIVNGIASDFLSPYNFAYYTNSKLLIVCPRMRNEIHVFLQ
jgi:hypothetical protein